MIRPMYRGGAEPPQKRAATLQNFLVRAIGCLTPGFLRSSGQRICYINTGLACVVSILLQLPLKGLRATKGRHAKKGFPALLEILEKVKQGREYCRANPGCTSSISSLALCVEMGKSLTEQDDAMLFTYELLRKIASLHPENWPLLQATFTKLRAMTKPLKLKDGTVIFQTEDPLSNPDAFRGFALDLARYIDEYKTKVMPHALPPVAILEVCDPGAPIRKEVINTTYKSGSRKIADTHILQCMYLYEPHNNMGTAGHFQAAVRNPHGEWVILNDANPTFIGADYTQLLAKIEQTGVSVVAYVYARNDVKCNSQNNSSVAAAPVATPTSSRARSATARTSDAVSHKAVALAASPAVAQTLPSSQHADSNAEQVPVDWRSSRPQLSPDNAAASASPTASASPSNPPGPWKALPRGDGDAPKPTSRGQFLFTQSIAKVLGCLIPTLRERAWTQLAMLFGDLAPKKDKKSDKPQSDKQDADANADGWCDVKPGRYRHRSGRGSNQHVQPRPQTPASSGSYAVLATLPSSEDTRGADEDETSNEPHSQQSRVPQTRALRSQSSKGRGKRTSSPSGKNPRKKHKGNNGTPRGGPLLENADKMASIIQIGDERAEKQQQKPKKVNEKVEEKAENLARRKELRLTLREIRGWIRDRRNRFFTLPKCKNDEPVHPHILEALVQCCLRALRQVPNAKPSVLLDNLTQEMRAVSKKSRSPLKSADNNFGMPEEKITDVLRKLDHFLFDSPADSTHGQGVTGADGGVADGGVADGGSNTNTSGGTSSGSSSGGGAGRGDDPDGTKTKAALVARRMLQMIFHPAMLLTTFFDRHHKSFTHPLHSIFRMQALFRAYVKWGDPPLAKGEIDKKILQHAVNVLQGLIFAAEGQGCVVVQNAKSQHYDNTVAEFVKKAATTTGPGDGDEYVDAAKLTTAMAQPELYHFSAYTEAQVSDAIHLAQAALSNLIALGGITQVTPLFHPNPHAGMTYTSVATVEQGQNRILMNVLPKGRTEPVCFDFAAEEKSSSLWFELNRQGEVTFSERCRGLKHDEGHDISMKLWSKLNHVDATGQTRGGDIMRVKPCLTAEDDLSRQAATTDMPAQLGAAEPVSLVQMQQDNAPQAASPQVQMQQYNAPQATAPQVQMQQGNAAVTAIHQVPVQPCIVARAVDSVPDATTATEAQQNWERCHRCQNKFLTNEVLFCQRIKYVRTGNPCARKFCIYCLAKYEWDDASTITNRAEWTCPACRDICSCSPCKKRREQRTEGTVPEPIVATHTHERTSDTAPNLAPRVPLQQDNAANTFAAQVQMQQGHAPQAAAAQVQMQQDIATPTTDCVSLTSAAAAAPEQCVQCHWCKHDVHHETALFCSARYFSRSSRPICRKIFCRGCLVETYKIDVSSIADGADWFCPACEGRCSCTYCKHKANKKATIGTVGESVRAPLTREITSDAAPSVGRQVPAQDGMVAQAVAPLVQMQQCNAPASFVHALLSDLALVSAVESTAATTAVAQSYLHSTESQHPMPPHACASRASAEAAPTDAQLRMAAHVDTTAVSNAHTPPTSAHNLPAPVASSSEPATTTPPPPPHSSRPSSASNRKTDTITMKKRVNFLSPMLSLGSLACEVECPICQGRRNSDCGDNATRRPGRGISTTCQYDRLNCSILAKIWNECQLPTDMLIEERRRLLFTSLPLVLSHVLPIIVPYETDLTDRLLRSVETLTHAAHQAMKCDEMKSLYGDDSDSLLSTLLSRVQRYGELTWHEGTIEAVNDIFGQARAEMTRKCKNAVLGQFGKAFGTILQDARSHSAVAPSTSQRGRHLTAPECEAMLGSITEIIQANDHASQELAAIRTTIEQLIATEDDARRCDAVPGLVNSLHRLHKSLLKGGKSVHREKMLCDLGKCVKRSEALLHWFTSCQSSVDQAAQRLAKSRSPPPTGTAPTETSVLQNSNALMTASNDCAIGIYDAHITALYNMAASADARESIPQALVDTLSTNPMVILQRIANVLTQLHSSVVSAAVSAPDNLRSFDPLWIVDLVRGLDSATHATVRNTPIDSVDNTLVTYAASATDRLDCRCVAAAYATFASIALNDVVTGVNPNLHPGNPTIETYLGALRMSAICAQHAAGQATVFASRVTPIAPARADPTNSAIVVAAGDATAPATDHIPGYIYRATEAVELGILRLDQALASRHSDIATAVNAAHNAAACAASATQAANNAAKIICAASDSNIPVNVPTTFRAALDVIISQMAHLCHYITVAMEPASSHNLTDLGKRIAATHTATVRAMIAFASKCHFPFLESLLKLLLNEVTALETTARSRWVLLGHLQRPSKAIINAFLRAHLFAGVAETRAAACYTHYLSSAYDLHFRGATVSGGQTAPLPTRFETGAQIAFAEDVLRSQDPSVDQRPEDDIEWIPETAEVEAGILNHLRDGFYLVAWYCYQRWRMRELEAQAAPSQQQSHSAAAAPDDATKTDSGEMRDEDDEQALIDDEVISDDDDDELEQEEEVEMSAAVDDGRVNVPAKSPKLSDIISSFFSDVTQLVLYRVYDQQKLVEMYAPVLDAVLARGAAQVYKARLEHKCLGKQHSSEQSDSEQPSSEQSDSGKRCRRTVKVPSQHGLKKDLHWIAGLFDILANYSHEVRWRVLDAMKLFWLLRLEEYNWCGETRKEDLASMSLNELLKLTPSFFNCVHKGFQALQPETRKKTPQLLLKTLVFLADMNEHKLLRNISLYEVFKRMAGEYERNLKLTLSRNKGSVLYRFFTSFADFCGVSLRRAPETKRALARLSWRCRDLCCGQSELDAVLAPLTLLPETDDTDAQASAVRFLPPDFGELLQDRSCTFGALEVSSSDADTPPSDANVDYVMQNADGDEDDEDEYVPNSDDEEEDEDKTSFSTPEVPIGNLLGWMRLSRTTEAIGGRGYALFPQQRGGIPKCIPLSSQALFNILNDVATIKGDKKKDKVLEYPGEASEFDKAYRRIVDKHQEEAQKLLVLKKNDLLSEILHPDFLKPTKRPRESPPTFATTDGICLNIVFLTAKKENNGASGDASASATVEEKWVGNGDVMRARMLNLDDVPAALAALASAKEATDEDKAQLLNKVVTEAKSMVQRHGASVKLREEQIDQLAEREDAMDQLKAFVDNYDFSKIIGNRKRLVGVDPNQREALAAFGQPGHFSLSSMQLLRDSGQKGHQYLMRILSYMARARDPPLHQDDMNDGKSH